MPYAIAPVEANGVSPAPTIGAIGVTLPGHTRVFIVPVFSMDGAAVPTTGQLWPRGQDA